MLNRTIKENNIPEHEPPNAIITILSCIVVVCIYMVGLYLHTKIILVSRKDKGMTWKFDIFNSCAVLFHYGNAIVIYGVTYIVQDVSFYTGDWFCYLFKFFFMEGNIYVLKHSCFIAAMKYVIIVHYEWVKEFGGNEKIKKIFFWMKVIYPSLVIAIFMLGRLDFFVAYGGISQANRCLGKSDLISIVDSNKPVGKMHDMCEPAEELLNPSQLQYAMYISRKTICWINVVWFYLNMWNFVEGFLYFRIFSFMRR